MEMWLLNVNTEELEYFEGGNIPKYAILSHRWESGEVLYQDIVEKTASFKKAYSKLRGCCKRAEQDGLRYVWVDTCCIDKKSSAELSEAINSMYRWYEDAEVCYAYLSDYQHNEHKEAHQIRIRHSIWFTRGWTLQELLAPEKVEFFDSEWKSIGVKNNLYIANEIFIATKIPASAIEAFRATSWTIAEKMLWAARRKTTRVEDQAYCLLGLCQVNMPLLYGEGPYAFLRLQQELCRTTLDRSIFLFPCGDVAIDELLNQPTDQELTPYKLRQREVYLQRLFEMSGFLAMSVKCFAGYVAEYVEVVASDAKPNIWGGKLYSLSNNGLSIEVGLRPICSGVYMAVIDGNQDDLRYICVKREMDNEYRRVILNGKWTLDESAVAHDQQIIETERVSQTILIRQQKPLELEFYGLTHGFDVRLHKDFFVDQNVQPCQKRSDGGDWKDGNARLRRFLELKAESYKVEKIRVGCNEAHSFVGSIYFDHVRTQELFVVTLGWDFYFEPIVLVQIWPKALSCKARACFGFTSAFGTKKLHLELSLKISRLVETASKHTGLRSSKKTRDESDYSDVVRLFATKGSKGSRYERFRLFLGGLDHGQAVLRVDIGDDRHNVNSPSEDSWWCYAEMTIPELESYERGREDMDDGYYDYYHNLCKQIDYACLDKALA